MAKEFPGKELLQLAGTEDQTHGDGREVASKRRKTLERELDWVRMAPKARQAKGKARLNSYDKLLNEDVKERKRNWNLHPERSPFGKQGDRGQRSGESLW